MNLDKFFAALKIKTYKINKILCISKNSMINKKVKSLLVCLKFLKFIKLNFLSLNCILKYRNSKVKV